MDFIKTTKINQKFYQKIPSFHNGKKHLIFFFIHCIKHFQYSSVHFINGQKNLTIQSTSSKRKKKNILGNMTDKLSDIMKDL